MYCHRDIIDRLIWNSGKPYYAERLERNMQLANMLERIGISTVGENTDLMCYIPLEPMPGKNTIWAGSMRTCSRCSRQTAT